MNLIVYLRESSKLARNNISLPRLSLNSSAENHKNQHLHQHKTKSWTNLQANLTPSLNHANTRNNNFSNRSGHALVRSRVSEYIRSKFTQSNGGSQPPGNREKSPPDLCTNTRSRVELSASSVLQGEIKNDKSPKRSQRRLPNQTFYKVCQKKD